MAENSIAINSATRMEYHTPSMPITSGSSNTAATWNTSVRRNEMSAEVSPSLSAVKNPDP